MHAHVPDLDLVDLDAQQAGQPDTTGLDEGADVQRYFPACDETYLATALICASVSTPLNAGMTAPPWMT